MSEISYFNEGSIIEYADKAKFLLAVVASFDEKSKKLKIISENNGRDLSITPKQVQLIIPGRISPQFPPSQIASELQSLKLRADAIAKHIDIEELYELLDETSSLTLEDIVDLLCSEKNGASYLAAIRAMRNDKFYFKTATPGNYTKRPPEIVESLKRQADAKAKKEQWKLDFVDESSKILAIPEENRESTLKNIVLPHSQVLDAWKLIENYAILGNDYSERNNAEELLSALQDKLNKGFAGTGFLRARDFLRKSMYFNKNTNIALLKYKIDEEFSDTLERDARAIYEQKLDSANRIDLTHLNIFSIDDADTLDVDDALSLEFLPNRQYRLGVHIAAPASVIPFDSPLETEARHRASSIYLPEKRIPMLPFILSENALSLLQGQIRNAVSFFLTFDDDFNLIDSKILPSIVCSKHKLSYETAEFLLEEGNDATADELRKIQEICEFSAQNRHNCGAIDVNLPEFKLKYSPENDTYDLIPIDDNMMSRTLVAECMILANVLTASFCAQHDIPTLFRIQPKPSALPSQKSLDELPNDYARAYAIRRAMQPATTTLHPAPHAGLGVEKYTQATSPLRRYTDLLCHYQLEYWFAHNTPRFDENTFNAILSEASSGLDNARAASHEAYRTATLKYLSQLGKTPLDAILLQYVADRGDLAQFALLQTQVRANCTTKSRLPIGSICRVAIDDIQPENDSISIKFIDTH